MRASWGRVILLLVLATRVFAQESEIRIAHFNLEKEGLAVQGYDPVAYFVQHKAMEGRKDIATIYKGTVYRFASAQNKETFNANPAQYEPQYGGWCAYAMGATGEKVEVDPETFKIVDGKLYLFYNSLFNNTLPTWNKDEIRLKSNADKNWMKLTR